VNIKFLGNLNHY